MRKLFLGLLLSSIATFATDDKINLEITGIRVNEGYVYLAIFNTEESYKKETPFKAQKLEGQEGQVDILLDLPSGDYVFAIYQDKNGNGKLDTNFMGIPKEHYALSNYNRIFWPGGFNKLKLSVNKDTKKITLNLK